MARRKTNNQSNGVGHNKMEAARRVLEVTPGATAGELSRAVRKQFGLNLNPKMASTYKYHIQKKAKSAKHSAIRGDLGVAGTGGSQTAQAAGVDDLLQAAQKLGWHRVKEVVDLVIQAPA
jgi:heme oxygenase